MISVPVVTSVMSAGLGNQLFEFAAAKALSLRLGARLRIDISAYEFSESKPEYQFWLGGLRHCEVVGGQRWGAAGRIYRKLGRFARRHYGPPEFHCFKLGFDPDFNKISGSIDLHGYFQSHRYFEHFKREVLTELRQIIAIRDRRPAEHVAVHVRRGDYLRNPGFSLADPDAYYREAMRLAAVECGPTTRFFIFSDDREWCAQSSLFEGATIVDDAGLSPPETLSQMAGFHSIIIANSSFSWWAAKLGPDESGGRVFCPAEWILGYPTRDIDLVPDRWTVVLDGAPKKRVAVAK